jgi:hypothetical protein
LGLLTALALLLPARQAAATATIRINEVPEPTQVTNATGTVGLSLVTTFTLLDSQDQVLRDFEIDTSTYELGGNTYPASITELDTPWSIVILVDASRTMGIATAGGAFKNARTALATAAGSIPDGANIAVLRFDDEVPTVQEFTQGKEAVSKAINDLRAKGFGNSCLNDGLYEAVNKLGGAPGRRAVLVFTASADNCANRTALDVTNLARQNRVQIYAAGLQGYAVTVDTLQALAEPTGGLAELKPESTLGFGLGNLTAVLNNQWSARATVYPSAGAQSATLKINLKDGLSLTSPAITFNSSQDYVPPTEIHLQGTVQSVGDGILFNLNLIEPEKIRQLNVSIIDKSTGQGVMAQALLDFSDVNTIPAVSLVAGQEYTLIVSAMDSPAGCFECHPGFRIPGPASPPDHQRSAGSSPEQPDLLVVPTSTWRRSQVPGLAGRRAVQRAPARNRDPGPVGRTDPDLHRRPGHRRIRGGGAGAGQRRHRAGRVPAGEDRLHPPRRLRQHPPHPQRQPAAHRRPHGRLVHRGDRRPGSGVPDPAAPRPPSRSGGPGHAAEGPPGRTPDREGGGSPPHPLPRHAAGRTAQGRGATAQAGATTQTCPSDQGRPTPGPAPARARKPLPASSATRTDRTRWPVLSCTGPESGGRPAGSAAQQAPEGPPQGGIPPSRWTGSGRSPLAVHAGPSGRPPQPDRPGLSTIRH